MLVVGIRSRLAAVSRYAHASLFLFTPPALAPQVQRLLCQRLLDQRAEFGQTSLQGGIQRLQGIDFRLLLLDALSQNGGQLLVSYRLVAVVVGSHRFGQHLFHLLRNEDLLRAVLERAVGELLPPPVVGDALAECLFAAVRLAWVQKVDQTPCC